jgi:hypothetical protein
MGVLRILWPEVGLSLLVEIPLSFFTSNFIFKTREGKRLLKKDHLPEDEG